MSCQEFLGGGGKNFVTRTKINPKKIRCAPHLNSQPCSIHDKGRKIKICFLHNTMLELKCAVDLMQSRKPLGTKYLNDKPCSISMSILNLFICRLLFQGITDSRDGIFEHYYMNICGIRISAFYFYFSLVHNLRKAIKPCSVIYIIYFKNIGQIFVEHHLTL